MTAHADSTPSSSTPSSWRTLSERLTTALKPTAPPVAITFCAPESRIPVERLPAAPAIANEHGRTGQVPAGCVFWMKGATQSFATTASDHANCSVGSYTHGFLTLQEAAATDDVCAVLEAGWVDQAAVSTLPHVTQKPSAVLYGPLADLQVAPDVVLLRLTAFGLMTLKDAFPALRIEGKPQCHIVAIAKEEGQVAASVGCALSRARTGMRPEELTCAIPASQLEAVVLALESTVILDRMMASYAAQDAKRFQ